MGSVLSEQKRVVDTNILIDFLRGRTEAIDFFNKPEITFLISTITVAELYSGVKGEDEEKMIEDMLGTLKIIPVTSSIAQKGGLIKKKYWGSHRVGIADAVIAATAIEESAKLITLNIKHFPMLEFKSAPY